MFGSKPVLFKNRSFYPTTVCFKSQCNIQPRNLKQKKYIDFLNDDSSIVIASGSAGTGKTMLATYIGLQRLKNGNVSKLLLTRPAVPVDEQHGFLPGSLEDKMDPWMRPLFDTIYKFYSAEEVSRLMKTKVIEICPIAYMRGRTFEDSFIVCDEVQNCTPKQILMILTRIGKNTKMVVTGDPMQSDIREDPNGLVDLLKRLSISSSNDIKYVEFEEVDIERHPLIRHIVDMYKQPLF